MLVLDYMRNTGDLDNPSTIRIPPFHSGHLGYIPPLDVNLVLLSEAKETACPCEIVVSSNEFQQNKNLALLECTMKDRVGLVNKIVSVLSKYQINILTMETTAHNHLNNHTLSMIIDFKTSNLRAKNTWKSSQNLYQNYSNLFPHNDYRYMKIFEDIMLICYEEITWNNTFGNLAPQFTIRPLKDFGDYKFPEPSKIQADKKLNLNLKIPRKIDIQLRNYLRVSQKEKLYYILHSDTDERLLRIFFPLIKTTNNIFHLAFFHNDIPGAINSILDLLAKSKFNILSSILRRGGEEKSVCEIIFEYTGEEKLKEFPNITERYTWVSKILAKNLNLINRAKDFGIEIGTPQYPKLKDDYSSCFDIFNNKKKKNNSSNSKFQHLNIEEIISKVKRQRIYSLEIVNKIELLSSIKKRQTKEDYPIIFLSYPNSAKKLANEFHQKFNVKYGGVYKVDEYQEPDNKDIPKQVMNKIKECDYFIGIWHEDEDFKSKNNKFSTSPWMLFEYGIAYDDGKPIILLQSDKLDSKVSQRIDPSKGEFMYNTSTFVKETLEKVEERLNELRFTQIKLNSSMNNRGYIYS